MSINTVLLLGRYGAANRERLAKQLTSRWQIAVWTPDESDEVLAERLTDADAVVLGADALLSGRALPQLHRAPKLRLLQIPFSGHNWLRPEHVPAGCTVCNLNEHQSTIAEFVMLLMLEWEIGLRRIDADFRQGSWRYAGSTISGTQHGEVMGKTVGLLGYGGIGREVAHRAAAFGMRVIATANRARETTPAPLDWLGTAADRERLYAESDYLVLCCPLTEATRGIIDRAALQAMKSSAVLINVARAEIAVEEDLYVALRDKVIAGAALDVWYADPTPQNPSPAPSRFPFQDLDNVIMTPHCAGWTAAQDARRWVTIADNLDRFDRGDALRNVVMSRESRPSSENEQQLIQGH